MTNSPLFTCSRCCCLEEYSVQVKIEDESPLKAVVQFNGIVGHSCQVFKRKPIRAEARPLIAETLSSKLPCNVFEHSEQVGGQCCATLSWAERRKQRHHQNDMISLQKDTDDQLIIMQPKCVML